MLADIVGKDSDLKSISDDTKKNVLEDICHREKKKINIKLSIKEDTGAEVEEEDEK